jgi:putative component of membrane protein insertase Oxa1/YidC/SpoIIIJ protein YidD
LGDARRNSALGHNLNLLSRWMTPARLLRCHPWSTSGLDFAPKALPANSR